MVFRRYFADQCTDLRKMAANMAQGVDLVLASEPLSKQGNAQRPKPKVSPFISKPKQGQRIPGYPTESMDKPSFSLQDHRNCPRAGV